MAVTRPTQPQPRRPVVDARAAVLRCLRVQLAAWRAGVWATLETRAANDEGETR